MTALMICGTTIRRDADGRYCLNDLHQAAGGEKRHQPSDWLRLQQTEALIAELSDPGIPGSGLPPPIYTKRGGIEQGTYVVKELVYSYAMWISPAFHLQVIRAYDRLVAAAPAPDPLAALQDPATLRGLLLTYSERVQRLEDHVHQQEPKVRALEQLAQADGAFNITTAAKMLQVRPRQLFAWLEQHQWIYRRAGSKNWLAYQPRLQSGVLVHKAVVVQQGDEIERVHEQVLVTAKGLARLSECINRETLGWTPADYTRAQQLATAGAAR